MRYTAMYPRAYSQSTCRDPPEKASRALELVDDVELMQKGSFFRVPCNPGDRAIAPNIVPTSNMKAYINREDVEFLQEGQALQHMEAAVPVQHSAHCKIITKKNLLMTHILFTNVI